MLLGKKTRYTVGSDWAVILDRSNNEFARNRAIEKLSQAFNLSLDEAKDLAENTPIILLDKLPLDIAEKIKDYFAQSNVDCSLTNDTFTKRKCFRAIWPTQPDLGRLVGENEEETETEEYISTPPKAIEEEINDLTIDLQKESQLFQSQDIPKKQSPQIFEHSESKETGSQEQILKTENQALLGKIAELEQNLKGLKLSADKEAKEQLSDLKAQLDHYRTEYLRTQNGAKQTQLESKQWQSELLQTQKILSQARAENEDLKRMLSQMQSDTVQLKEDAEKIKKEIENRFLNQSGELEEWKRKANDWSANYFKVIKENEYLRAHQNEEMESIKVRNQQMTTQLEQAQRQIREFVGQLEQQDLIQKRMRSASEMAEQEAHLKILVHKQKTLEEEIRTRDEEMKKVLLDQESVERAIISAKQAQKYLLEQSKLKDKNRTVRPKIVNPSISEGPGSSSFQSPESESND